MIQLSHAVVSLISVLVLSLTEASMPGKTLLVMGDSLAAGQLLDYQFFSDQGWANVLYDHLETNYGFDTLINSACSAEETRSFLDSNPGNSTECSVDSDTPPSLCYAGLCDAPLVAQLPGDSQMEAVETYIATHPGEVGLLAIAIGINDVVGCATDADPLACATRSVGLVGENLDEIVPRLIAAAPGVPIIGTVYFNPFVALYLSPETASLAFLAEQLLPVANSVVETAFVNNGAYVADTFAAINGDDTTGTPRADVVNVCIFTEMCSEVDGEYVLTDDLDLTNHQHPTPVGYEQMAKAYIAVVEDNEFFAVPATNAPTVDEPEVPASNAPTVDEPDVPASTAPTAEEEDSGSSNIIMASTWLLVLMVSTYSMGY